MKFSYSFHPAAQKEYETAVKWYRKQSVLAAENFVTAVDATLEKICSHPGWWRNSFENFFELGVANFPYSLIYIVERSKKSVLIVACFHHKQHPKKKYPKY